MDPGNYYIINAAPGELAANFDGIVPLIVANMAPGLMAQQWMVAGAPDAPQTIAPLVDPALHAGPAGGFVEALPPVFAWNIIPNGVGFIISNPDADSVWAIDMAAEGQQIVLQPLGGGPFQVWTFLPV